MLACWTRCVGSARPANWYAGSRRGLIALRPAAEPLVFHDDGALDLSDVIPGFTLDIGELFAPLAPDRDPVEGSGR